MFGGRQNKVGMEFSILISLSLMPRRWRASDNLSLHAFLLFAQAMGEIRQQLFFARHDIAQFVDARFEARMVDALDEFLIAHDEQQ